MTVEEPHTLELAWQEQERILREQLVRALNGWPIDVDAAWAILRRWDNTHEASRDHF